jgi:beta-lactamase regulating signal transducer with metallopeptidase domain
MTEMVGRSLVLSLAWFAAVSALASAISLLVAVAILKMRPRRRPLLLVTVRLFPAVASLLFVGAMFVPSQWAFEPRNTEETFGLVWYVLAIVGATVLAKSAVRALSVAHAGRQLRLSQHGRMLGHADVREIDDLPGVSLAGILRPRILVNSQVAEDLSDAELDVAIAHEVAHRDALDNLTRWAFVCAPDLLGGSAIAKRLEQEWCEAAEFRADARATRGDGARALHLASALIKVARLSAVWTGKSPDPFWSTLHNSALLELRVKSLVNGRVPRPEPLPHPILATAVCFAGVVVVVPLVAETIHRLTESLVTLLP